MVGADDGLRRVVLAVALLNLGYFGVEFAVALAIGSVALFADSVDFLEDASINLLIALALAWSARSRAILGKALAVILLVPAPPPCGRRGRSSTYPRRRSPCRFRSPVWGR